MIIRRVDGVCIGYITINVHDIKYYNTITSMCIKMRTSQNIDEQPVSIHNAADVAIYIIKYVYVYYML